MNSFFLAKQQKNARTLSQTIGHGLVIGSAMLLAASIASAQSLAPAYTISAVAGTGSRADTGDNGPATAAKVGAVAGAVVDRQGNLYFSDATYHVVRRVDAVTGIITTVAGVANSYGTFGDGGPATKAYLHTPIGLAIDNDGNLLIADEGNHAVRKVIMTNGVSGNISVVAGTFGAAAGSASSSGPATSAVFGNVVGVAVDRAGNIYIADNSYHVVRMVDPSGTIHPYAGTGTGGYTGDGGPASSAEIKSPYALSVDDAGNLLIGDSGNNVIREVDTSAQHLITTIVGGSATPGTTLSDPQQALADNKGDIFVLDRGHYRILMVAPGGSVTTIVNSGGASGNTGNGGPAINATFGTSLGMGIDVNNNLYIPDYGNYVVRKVSLTTQQPATKVGSTDTAQKLLLQANADVTPNTLTITPTTPAEFTAGALTGCSLGTLLPANTLCTVPITFSPALPGLRTAQLAITDTNNNVSAIGLYGTATAPETSFSGATLSTVLGDGTAGNSASEVNAPRGGVIDSAGNLYFADSGNNVIRKVAAGFATSTVVAGNGTAGYTGDTGSAVSAELNAPSKVVVDAAGNLYIADTGNSVVRFVNAATGNISTIAGNGTAGYTGDGGPATAAELNRPQGLAVDLGGHVYVADTGNNVVRYFGPNGLIVTWAGTGTAGYAGDGANAAMAELSAPQAVALDSANTLYIADTGNDVVRVIASRGNDIATLAGQQGVASNSGDGAAASAATLNAPSDVAVDPAGDAYIAASGQVRLVNAAGTISTVAGSGLSGSYSGEGGPATNAVLPSPVSNLMVDNAGNIVLADTAANRLLEVAVTTSTLNLGTVSVGTVGAPSSITVLNPGNSTLSITGIAASANFDLGTGGASLCSTSTTLAPGASCTINVSLDAGNISSTQNVTGTVTLTDNALNNTSATQTIQLTGNAKAIPVPTVTVTVAPTALVYGDTPTITAALSNGASPTGTVNFLVDGGLVATETLAASQAAYTLPASLSAGPHTISVAYLGDANNGQSNGSINVTVQPAVATVAATNTTSAWGAAIPTTFAYTITGLVNGDTASVISGTPVLSTTATSPTTSGNYPITVALGTLTAANYTFALVNGTLTISPEPPPTFTVDVAPGSPAIGSTTANTALVTITPLYGYSGTVNITCSSAPVGLTCDKASLTSSSAGTPVSATIHLTLPATASLSGHGDSSGLVCAIGLPLVLLGFSFGKRGKLRLPHVLLGMCLLAAATMWTTACGGTVSQTRVATGAYQVTVTATDSSANLSNSNSFTLTVQ
jgi:sugar lactone lactonase YvrE